MNIEYYILTPDHTWLNVDVDQYKTATKRRYETMRVVDANEVEYLQKQNERLREFVEEVRRTGDTRLASMAIAVLASVGARNE